MPTNKKNASFSAILAVWIFFIPSALRAANSYYNVVMSGSDGTTEVLGYAEMDWDNNGRIAGRICAYEDTAKDDRNLRSDLGVVSVEGVNFRNGKAELNLKLDASAKSSTLGSLIPDHPIAVIQYGSGAPNYKYVPEAIIGWFNFVKASETSKSADKLSLALEPITRKLIREGRFAHIVKRSRGGKKIIRRFDLSAFDTMTVEQALAIRARTKFDELVAPGAVLVKYEPARRAEIIAYLGKFRGLAKLVDTPPPNCGAPHVDDIVDVPPLLEFYFARQLVLSNLFITAFPEIYPKSPPFEPITTGLRSISEIFTDASLQLEQKSNRLGGIFEKEILSFLNAKRPRFAGRWELEPRTSGAPLGYRVRVVGAMTSQCERDGWEMFDVQFIPSNLEPGGRLSLLLQVVEGYEAPGELKERPSDKRFEDNKLKDDRLSKIQGALVQHLKGRGFRQDFPGEGTTQRYDPCPL